jgi:transposase
LEKESFLKLYFTDESGFSLTSNIPYGWQEKGNPISTCPTSSKRLNVFGIMNATNNELFTFSKTGSVKNQFIIDAIYEFAGQINEPSVLVFDNAKIHHSEAFMEHISIWKEMGIEIFYLPTYSPHLNLIEILWRKIKYEWLRPDDFLNWDTLNQRIKFIFDNFGSLFKIDFSS